MIITISLVLIILASLLVFIRLFIGPRKEDRMVALDSGTTITAVLLVLLGSIYNRVIFLDVAMIYAVLSFVAVIVSAKYLKGEL